MIQLMELQRKLRKRLMSIDFPRAWQIAQATQKKDHDPRCSFRVTDGALLCDCAIITEHPEYKDDILQTLDGEIGKKSVKTRSQK